MSTVEPIEQILGWMPSVHHVPGSLQIGWRRADGTWTQQATADDLAAWLDQHGYRGLRIVCRLAPAMDGQDWSVSGFGNYPPTGRSIFGALEAAVRHVHGQVR